MKTKINQAAPTGTREPWESEADRRGVRYWMELLFNSWIYNYRFSHSQFPVGWGHLTLRSGKNRICR